MDENYKGFLQKTHWYSRAQSGKVWWFQPRITKFSVKDVNHDIIIDTLLWYKSWQFLQSYPENSVQNYPAIIVRLHHTDQKQMGLLREQCVEVRKGHLRYYCIQVVGGFHGTLLPSAKNFRICLMGRHHMKGGSESHLTDQLSRLEQWSNITMFLRNLSRRHQFGSKVLPAKSFGCVLYAGESGKVTFMVQDIEELEQMDASELHAQRLNAKEVLTPTKGEKFIFPVADGTVKIFWRRSGSENIHLNPGQPRERGEEQDILRGEPEGCSSTPRQDASWYDGEAKIDFWSISGDFIYSHHVEHRVKLYVPTEDHALFHWNTLTLAELSRRRYMWCRRETYWWLLECWWRSSIVRLYRLLLQDSLNWVRSRRMAVHGPRGDWQENKRPQGPTNYGQKFGNV